MEDLTNKYISEPIELLPDPQRVSAGLRDTGYNFNTAVADIVDNSIAANATKMVIELQVSPDGHVKVYFADNGCGMDQDGLINAMKYGSKERDNKKSLGKFGLGLKTASSAFCKKYSLVSRANPDEKLIKVEWNLDFIAQQGKWLLQFPAVTEDEIDMLESVAGNGSGTLLVWDDIDRIKCDYTYKKAAEKNIKKLLDDLRFHLSMVFQRFLNTEDSRAQNIEIIVNGQKLVPWDPFCKAEPNTEELQSTSLEIDVAGYGTLKCDLAAYVIPKRGEYSSIEAEKNARGGSDMQGIYVYRENRLIHYGDWFGLMKREPHLTLLRVAFSFDYQMDDLFSIDIKKSRILLIPELLKGVEEFLGAPRREADKRYRDTETKVIGEKSKNAHTAANQRIENTAPRIETSTVTPISQEKAEIKNVKGQTYIKEIAIKAQASQNQTRVDTAPSLEGNALWEPALIEGKHAVKLNESHPFYKKVYGPNLSNSLVIEALDDIFWSLAEASLSTCDKDCIENYEDLRHLVSRKLKTLVEDLPDPEIDEDNLY